MGRQQGIDALFQSFGVFTMQHLKASLQSLHFSPPVILYPTTCWVPQQVLSFSRQGVQFGRSAGAVQGGALIQAL